MSYRKKRESPKRLKLIFLTGLLMMIGIMLLHLSKDTRGIGDLHKADISKGWNLILVNREYRIPDHYQEEIKLTTLTNGKKVDTRIYPDLQAMFDDARSTGLQLFVREGYRTSTEQRKIYDDKIVAYQDEGYTKSEAERLTKKWVAIPGTSEHEIGLAVDINADTSKCTKDEVYSWLENNSYKYGFIKRYPSDKADITGISNEPWHYRYVGKEAAETIYSKKICLEEYLEQLENKEP